MEQEKIWHITAEVLKDGGYLRKDMKLDEIVSAMSREDAIRKLLAIYSAQEDNITIESCEII